MVSNPQRRSLLADAGLRVLAASGARGLTHRAVDTEAGVPAGTASNYFRSRDALLAGLGERIFERLAPDPAGLVGRTTVADFLRYIVERTTAQPDLTRALFELRLEGGRNPALGRLLAGVLHEGYRQDVAFHTGAGLPGGAFEVALLHYALDGLLFDLLTTSIGADVDVTAAIEALADRLTVARI
ncbi:TetR family transcriptional regulator [Dactylosporangium sp. AC04546]|uniref:TetR/AcrR family transcriptional regulator n=1 Tax=Dactylosporangium sp. AC04546 TaxID=2862460 RepID=UPI001EDEA453|nr:TetR/AcrR family transcriptional regulator [Dactylosporangium sp. AC04546]WVK80037.1 TetR family transcriptional regulator [Dactylosporangium sp. AC04546]